MRPTILIRSTVGRVGFFAVAALAAGLIAQALWTAGIASAARLAAYPVFVLVVVWLAWFYPRVEVSDRGVVIVNPLRSATIPHSAIIETTARGALRIITDRQKYTAWAAPARGGYRESTRPPAASPSITQGVELQTISADAATTARLIDEEKIIRMDATYQREVASCGRTSVGQETGWRWNVPAVAIFVASIIWVVFSATY